MSRTAHDLDSEALTDQAIVEHLKRENSCTINELIDFAGVTATAIRHRLNRMMESGLVKREAVVAGRGRPVHQYSLTEKGNQLGGDNYRDLATVLWEELRAIKDPEIKRGLLTRVVSRLAEKYREKLQGENLDEKMTKLANLMSDRDLPFKLEKNDDSLLPVLSAHACPYPELAEQDRGICSLEKMLFSEILGESIKLSSCRLDGEGCCTFEASANQQMTI